MQRFPVIPPFNIPDLAGWTDNRQKMDPVFFGEAFHPISRHFNNTTVPRSFYYAGLNQRFIYLSAPDISTDYITIPVSGVTALVRLHDASLKLYITEHYIYSLEFFYVSCITYSRFQTFYCLIAIVFGMLKKC